MPRRIVEVAKAGLAGVTSMDRSGTTTPLSRQLNELTTAEVRPDDPPTLKALNDFLRVSAPNESPSNRAMRPLIQAKSVRVQAEIIKAIIRMLDLVHDFPQMCRPGRELSFLRILVQGSTGEPTRDDLL